MVEGVNKMTKTHLGSFTNLPELEGQIDPDTGEKYIYTPKLPWWRNYKEEPVTSPEVTMDGERAIIESPTGGYAGSIDVLPEARKAQQKDERTLTEGKERETAARAEAAAKRKMPDRETFIKEFVVPKVGGVDPYYVDPYKVGMQRFRQEEAALVKKMFPDVPDGGLLTTEQKNFKIKALERARIEHVNRATQEVKMWKDIYDHMLVEYDRKVKEDKIKKKAESEFETFKKKERFKKELTKEYEKPGDITKLTDFKFAFKLWQKRHAKGTIEEFKKEWEGEKGALGEGSVLRSINEMAWNADDPAKWAADMYNKYLGYRGEGMSREAALNQVQKEGTAPETKVVSGMTFEKQEDGSWLRAK